MQVRSSGESDAAVFSAIGGMSPWPLTIDIVEWVATVTGSEQLWAHLQLLCPSYDEARAVDIRELPGPDDLVEQTDAVAGADFLLRQLVEDIVSCAAGLVIDVGALDMLSQTDFTFVVRLARAARERGGPTVMGTAEAALGERLAARGLHGVARSTALDTRRVAVRDVASRRHVVVLSAFPSDHHGTWPRASKNPPVGPASSRSASLMDARAPSSTVCVPRLPFKSVAV